MADKKIITLCQFYDAYSKRHGWNSWNHYCASVSPESRAQVKEMLKRTYKKLAGTQTPAEKLADGDVSSNQPEGGSSLKKET